MKGKDQRGGGGRRGMNAATQCDRHVHTSAEVANIVMGLFSNKLKAAERYRQSCLEASEKAHQQLKKLQETDDVPPALIAMFDAAVTCNQEEASIVEHLQSVASSRLAGALEQIEYHVKAARAHARSIKELRSTVATQVKNADRTRAANQSASTAWVASEAKTGKAGPKEDRSKASSHNAYVLSLASSNTAIRQLNSLLVPELATMLANANAAVVASLTSASSEIATEAEQAISRLYPVFQAFHQAIEAADTIAMPEEPSINLSLPPVVRFSKPSVLPSSQDDVPASESDSTAHPWHVPAILPGSEDFVKAETSRIDGQVRAMAHAASEAQTTLVGAERILASYTDNGNYHTAEQVVASVEEARQEVWVKQMQMQCLLIQLRMLEGASLAEIAPDAVTEPTTTATASEGQAAGFAEATETTMQDTGAAPDLGIDDEEFDDFDDEEWSDGGWSDEEFDEPDTASRKSFRQSVRVRRRRAVVMEDFDYPDDPRCLSLKAGQVVQFCKTDPQQTLSMAFEDKAETQDDDDNGADDDSGASASAENLQLSSWAEVKTVTNETGLVPRAILRVFEGSSRSLARTAHAYEAEEEDQLTFPENDVLTVLQPDDGSGWVEAYYRGHKGLCPASYLDMEFVIPLPASEYKGVDADKETTA